MKRDRVGRLEEAEKRSLSYVLTQYAHFLSGHTHLSLCCVELTTTTTCSSCSRLGCWCRPTVRPFWVRGLAGHGPSEEAHAHLQQLVVDHGRRGVLLG